MKKLTTDKLIRKIKATAQQWIPHHTHYRPEGFYPTAKQYAQAQAATGAAYIELHPAHEAEMDISQAFYNACSPYLKPNLKAQFPPAFVVNIPQGRLYTDLFDTCIAVVSGDNHLVADASYQWIGEASEWDPAKNLIFKQRYFEEPAYYKGTVFSTIAAGGAKDVYFHWMFDSFCRIALLKQAGLFEQVDWFFVPCLRHKFQREMLALLGIPPEKVIDNDRVKHLRADVLIAPSHPRGNDLHIPAWACHFFRDELAPRAASQLPKAAEFSPRVYISRGDARWRKVLNEPELIALLGRYGFKPYQLGKMSLAEQVALFAQAKAVFAPHGAGLANLAYCQPATKVTEFFSAGYVRSTYYDLSNKAQLAYRYLICQTDKPSESLFEGIEEDITVDLALVEKWLQQGDIL